MNPLLERYCKWQSQCKGGGKYHIAGGRGVRKCEKVEMEEDLERRRQNDVSLLLSASHLLD